MTMKRNPANERVKRRYLQFLSDVKGRDEASLDDRGQGDGMLRRI